MLDFRDLAAVSKDSLPFTFLDDEGNRILVEPHDHNMEQDADVGGAHQWVCTECPYAELRDDQ